MFARRLKVRFGSRKQIRKYTHRAKYSFVNYELGIYIYVSIYAI